MVVKSLAEAELIQKLILGIPMILIALYLLYQSWVYFGLKKMSYFANESLIFLLSPASKDKRPLVPPASMKQRGIINLVSGIVFVLLAVFWFAAPRDLKIDVQSIQNGAVLITGLALLVYIVLAVTVGKRFLNIGVILISLVGACVVFFLIADGDPLVLRIVLAVWSFMFLSWVFVYYKVLMNFGKQAQEQKKHHR